MAVEDSLDIFGSDPFGRDYLYGLSTGQERLGLQPPPQGLQLDTRPYDQMQATPRGFTSGLFSDVLGRTLNMPSMPRTGIPALDLLYMNRNPVLNMMGVGDVQKTAERISYGQPLTTGSGMTLKPREEAVFAGMAVAPFVGEAVNLGARAGRAGARMVGERIAENVAMGRPNLPSMLAEPRSSLFAVEPNPSMAAANESSAMRQQLTGKMQALLAQKKMATSAVEVGVINQQIGELQAQFKSLPAVGRVAREVVAPQITAPVSELGFYSAAEQAAMNLERSKGTGQSFLNDLMNAPDVKKDELSWIGLDDFLKDKPNVTKQEVQDFIASNKIDLQEVQLSGKGEKSPVFSEFFPDTGKYHVFTNDMRLQGLFDTPEEANAFVSNYNSSVPYAPSKYDKFQLAGGENYREILLKLPEKTRPVSLSEVNAERAKISPLLEPLSQAQYDDLVRSGEVGKIGIGGQKYKSSHFDEPNILAHMRVNDRIDADGKKMLLIEEIQSDWHQAGREKGYAKPETKRLTGVVQADPPSEFGFAPEFRVVWEDGTFSGGYGSREAAAARAAEGKSNAKQGVPDAPFKDTWYQLALKRAIKYAADNGYERIGLTTGKQQVERFDLSKQVDNLLYSKNSDGTYSVSAQVQGRGQMLGESIPESKLADYVGKEVAERMSKGIGKKTEVRGQYDPVSMTASKEYMMELSGDGLKIGGEGMKKYYDEIYPRFLEKYSKKWNSKVGETRIKTNRGKEGEEPIRYIDITPEMKEGVKKGQPLAAAEQTPEMLASGGLDYADPFRNPLLESSIG